MPDDAWRIACVDGTPYAEYQRLLRTPTDLAQWLEMDEEIEFEIDPVGLDIRSVDV
jgi:hypothetical protein